MLVSRARWNLRPENRLSAVLARVRRSRSCCRGSPRTRSGGQPRFPRLSPRSSSAVDIRRRQPRGEMEVPSREIDALNPSVLAVDGVRHDSRAGHPERVPGIVQPLLIESSIPRRAEGAGGVEIAGVEQARRPVRRAVSVRGTATPTSPPPRGAMVPRGAHGQRGSISRSGPSKLTRKQEPYRRLEQHPQQGHVTQKEYPEIHRRWAGTR